MSGRVKSRQLNDVKGKGCITAGVTEWMDICIYVGLKIWLKEEIVDLDTKQGKDSSQV